MIYISSDEGRYPVTKTFTPINYTSPNYTSLHLSTLHDVFKALQSLNISGAISLVTQHNIIKT